MAMEIDRLSRDKQVLEDQLKEKARQQQELSGQWDLERGHLNQKLVHELYCPGLIGEVKWCNKKTLVCDGKKYFSN